jgi:filamentous hemagglutinin family protein
MLRFSNRKSNALKAIASGFVRVVSSASIVLASLPISASAQQIIVDPSAPGTTFLQTSNGTPLVNIATPQSGVSVNKYNEFNVGADGLILNNSTSNGTSVIGQNVTANTNLMVSGPANTIVNEVTSLSPSSLIGTTEVFGQSAAVIIANPNGISCNGCSFINSTNTVLTTGTPIVNGAEVDLLVTKGTVSVGPDGVHLGQQGGLFGRHVVVNGPITTDGKTVQNGIVVSGGAQRVDGLDFERIYRTPIASAITLDVKTSPFAVDISEAGSITGGDLRVRGMEVGSGVNLYGDVDARSLYANSKGDLFYKNVTSIYGASFYGQNIRQYGDVSVGFRDVIISGDSFTLYDGRTISANAYTALSGIDYGNVKISADEFVTIAGEVTGANIEIDVSNGSLTNTGFLMADGDLTIEVADHFKQQRNIADEYDEYFDPVIQQYLETYYAQLAAGGAEADLAAEMIARANSFELIAQYIDEGASSAGTNVSITSGGVVVNRGGAIVATNDLSISAEIRIMNDFLALQKRLGIDDGCPTEDCGYKTEFHGGEILAGNDLVLTSGRDIKNRASHIAAANNITINAGRDIANSMTFSEFETDENVAVSLSYGVGTWVTQCDGGPNEGTCSPAVLTIEQVPYTGWDYIHTQESILAPGRIVSLYGDIDIDAGRDFISQGSEVSAGRDLTIDAVGQVILASHVANEESFVTKSRVLYQAGYCTGAGEGYTCNSGYHYWGSSTYGEITLLTATTDLIGRNVSVTAGENVTILGARIFAANDLDITSTTGSVLIDSTDLPDTVTTVGTADVQFVELSDDMVGQIFGTIDSETHLAILQDTYTTFLSDSQVKGATRLAIKTQTADLILNQAIAIWQSTYDPENPTDISDAFGDLETDADLRKAMAQQIIQIVGNVLDEKTGENEDFAGADLNEYALLQKLIADGTEGEALEDAALVLMDVLLGSISASTVQVEADATPATPIADMVERQKKALVFNQLYNELASLLPDGQEEVDLAEFKGSSVDDARVSDFVKQFATVMSGQLGTQLTFEEGEELSGSLAYLTTDEDFQRLVLEMSLLLAPDNPANVDGIPDKIETRLSILDNTTTDERLLMIQSKLEEFAPVLHAAVVQNIEDKQAQDRITLVKDQEIVVWGTYNGQTNAMLDLIAGKMGEEAKTQYAETIASNSDAYVQMLLDDNLLTAVEVLKRADSGADIRDAVRAVGVQSYVSLLESADILALKESVTTALETLHTSAAAGVNVHDQAASTYHLDVRNNLKGLIAELDLTEEELADTASAAVSLKVAAYQAAVTQAEDDYQSALDANYALYAIFLTQTSVRTRTIQTENGPVPELYYVQVPNPHYRALKNAADAEAASHKAATLNALQTDLEFDVAIARAAEIDTDIADQIAALSSDYDAEIVTLGITKATLLEGYNLQIQNAMGLAAQVLEQQALEDELSGSMVRAGTIEEGEANLASALTTDGFGDLSVVESTWINENGIVKIGNSNKSLLGAVNPNRQEEFIDATAWRFANHSGRQALGSTPRTVMMAQGDLTLTAASEAAGDIYITGETAIAANNDLTVQAGRRIGVLGAINTNFRQEVGNGVRETGYFDQVVTTAKVLVSQSCDKGSGCENTYANVVTVQHVWVPTGTEEYSDGAYDAFEEIGETLQLGTLMRDPYLSEAPTYNPDAPAGETNTNYLAYAQHTSLYDLTSTSLSAGGDLTLTSGGDILNFGGSLLSEENTILTANTDIRNEALRQNFTLTAAHGCVAYGCGSQGHEYKSGEILAGLGLIATAGGDIINSGSVMGAGGDILLAASGAESNIINKALTSQYLYHYVNQGGFFSRRKELLNRAVISESEISTEFGDITIESGQDILIDGSKVSAGGDVSLTAANDIQLYAKAEELKNYRKVRGFSGLSYGQTKTYWNDFATAFASVEGENIYFDAGNNVQGIGARLFANADISVVAGENITFDAHQNDRYEYTSGWSFGISFGGSGLINALLTDDDVFDAYMATNSTLAAVHRIGQGDFSLGSLINLGYHAPSLGQAIGIGGSGGTDFSQSLFEQLNPFSWTKDNALFNAAASGPADALINKKGFLNGVTFRFGVHKSSREWTESYVSQIVAGQDLWLETYSTANDSGDINLVGGTVASANENALVSASGNVLVAALSDTTRSESSSWGLSLGLSADGYSFGADFNQSHGQSEMFTNATLTAGGDLDVISGKDTVLMGANLKANSVYMDVGQDLKVLSRQNLSSSNSFGFNFTISQSSFTGGMNFSDANRVYTDTPTTIIAENRLSIYTERDTYLMGAAIYSEVGNLKIDTDTLIFDNYDDSDVSTSGGIDGTIAINDVGATIWGQSDVSGAFDYSNTQAVTYATIGAGEISIREAPEGFDLVELNRDPDAMQQIVSEQSFSIEIPGVNLKRWTKQVEDSVNLLEAITATAPDRIRAEGSQAVDQWRDLIFNGLSPQEAAQLSITPKYRNLLRGRNAYEQALADGTLTDQQKALALAMIAQGEKLEYDGDSKELFAIVGCATSGAGYSATPCGATSFNELAFMSYADVSSFIEIALNVALEGTDAGLEGLSDGAKAQFRKEQLQLAIECAIAWSMQGGAGNNSQGNDDDITNIYELALTALPDTLEYQIWRDRLDISFELSFETGLSFLVGISNAQEHDGVGAEVRYDISFEVLEIARMARSSDPEIRALAWEYAQTLHLEKAMYFAGDEATGVQGYLASFLTSEFPEHPNALETLGENYALADQYYVEEYQAYAEEFGVAAALLAGAVIMKRVLKKHGHKIKPFMKKFISDESGSVSIPTIGGRRPQNSKWAGKTHKASGVEFDNQGFPKFSKYAEASFEADNLTGIYAQDAKMANKEAGFNRTPEGFVWHHHQDGKTLELIPQKIHNVCKHTGGCAIIRNGGSFD